MGKGFDLNVLGAGLLSPRVERPQHFEAREISVRGAQLRDILPGQSRQRGIAHKGTADLGDEELLLQYVSVFI